MDKRELREKMKAVRAAVPNPDGVSAAVTRAVLDLDEVRCADTVLCYVSFGTEVSTHELIRTLISRGKRVYVPKTYAGGVMDAVEIASLDELETGRYGVPEPSDGKIAEKSLIDIVILPALCYDKLGYRLGYGGGYYDRYLKDYGGVKLGICPQACVIDDVRPEAHDVRADIVVTQSGVFRTNEKRGRVKHPSAQHTVL